MERLSQSGGVSRQAKRLYKFGQGEVFFLLTSPLMGDPFIVDPFIVIFTGIPDIA
jgi:hypothetical protein